MAYQVSRSHTQRLAPSTTTDLGLGERYVFRDEDAVRAYLDTHPHLNGILQEAEPEIVRYFDVFSTVALDVIDDPETIGERALTAFIRTTLPPRDALDQLRRLDRAWWIQRTAPVREEIELSLEFVR